MRLPFPLVCLPLCFTFPSANNVPSFEDISAILSKPLGEIGKGSSQIDEEITAEDRRQFQAMLKRQKRNVEFPETSKCNEIMDDNDRKQFAQLLRNQTRIRRNALNYPLFKWPNNVLYYQIDKAYDARAKETIKKSIAMLQDVTCVNFVESSSNYDRVMVWKGAHCNSEIGRKTGTQPLSLGDTCLQEALIMHEFIHALGFIHTQTAPNRDQYISVYTNGLSESVKSNFQMLGLVASYTPYDYGSLMHYAANAFSQTVPTMLPKKDARFIHTMGGQWMSFNDKLAISKHYNCSGGCNPKTAAKCENGGFPHPRNCAKCICPAGYGGNLCGDRPGGCGSTVEAKAYWQDLKYNVKTTDNEDKRSPYGFCNHWITAPAGTKVQVRVRSQIWFPGVWDDQECSYGCTRIGVEIKVDNNKQATNPRICCSSFFGDIHTSALNPTPIISHTFRAESSFHLDYRYVLASTPSSGPVVPDSKCSDSILHCPERVMRGFCEDTSMSLIDRRKQCGMTCNLCKM